MEAAGSVGREMEQIAGAGALHPEPLLSVEELRRLTSSTVPAADLKERLHSRPDLFRALDFWRGPLRSLTPLRHPFRPAYRRALAEQGLTSGVRVVCREPEAGLDPPCERSLEGVSSHARVRRQLREGVAAVARYADAGSFVRLLRLARLVKEEQRVRMRLDRLS